MLPEPSKELQGGSDLTSKCLSEATQKPGDYTELILIKVFPIRIKIVAAARASTVPVLRR